MESSLFPSILQETNGSLKMFRTAYSTPTPLTVSRKVVLCNPNPVKASFRSVTQLQ